MQKLVLIMSLVLLFSSCQKEETKAVSFQNSGSGSCSSGAAAGNTGAVFSIGDLTVSQSELPTDLKQYVYQNENEAYRKNEGAYKELAVRIHLAKKQGKFKDISSVPSLPELIESKKVTEQQAKEFYEQSKDRLPPGVDFEKMKPQIMQYLDGQQIGMQFKNIVDELEKSGDLKFLIAAPLAPELKIDTAGFPTTGNKSASVKVIEVSDYMCGHCQHAHPMVKEILKKFSDKISFTQVNFSLNEAGMSGTYVRGAVCALKSGEEVFWKYHHKAFELASAPHDHSQSHAAHNDGNSQEALDAVGKVAKEIGLEAGAFQNCLKGEESRQSVASTNDMLNALGINSTPTFIVNNKRVETGVQGLEKAINEALGN